MRGCVDDYDGVEPATMRDALESLAGSPREAYPLAGGTDLMVWLEAGTLPRGRYVSLARVPELHGIQVAQDWVTIGAAVTFVEIRRHSVLRSEFPNVVAAASVTGGPAIQNRATIGGNIVNASPAADTPPALLAYGAELELVSLAGVRRVPYASFHTGYRTVALGAGELVQSVCLPRRAQTHFFRKVAARQAQAIAKVVVAASAVRHAAGLDVQLAMGAVGPTVVRCRHVEALAGASEGRPISVERMRLAVLADTSPIDDLRSTRDYRLHVSTMTALEAVRSLWSGHD